jgi:hypothetical protein
MTFNPKKERDATDRQVCGQSRSKEWCQYEGWIKVRQTL